MVQIPRNAKPHSQVFGLETRLDPFVERLDVAPRQTEQKRYGAPVQVTGVGAQWRVDVCVCVDPDELCVGVFRFRPCDGCEALLLAMVTERLICLSLQVRSPD